ncbi:hypothetical protein HMPREF9151_00125 [Hoylesella saccharolytica F0055]|uniref:Uncharacterized protein n=1 Tax=Hoylesella saccharolytica F0055 TaxID=1127699 RepID=L1NKX2_9BACT|nr:hypothetical protein HMPREF9151_00125 [Hoylesella saccharolytica F0055]
MYFIDFCVPKSIVLPPKTIVLGLQKLCFQPPKPMLLQGKS